MKKVPWLKWAKNGDFTAFVKGAPKRKKKRKEKEKNKWHEINLER